MNGLTNAAKYGGGGGAGIELRAHVSDGSELVLEVLDSGPGLQGRTLKDLGTEFAELPLVAKPHTSVTGDGGGTAAPSAFSNVRSTGMGLPICLRLAKLMGGSLELSDRTDGLGLCTQRLRTSCGLRPVCLTVLDARVLARIDAGGQRSPCYCSW
jgi:signal transduction histidine kinase